MVVEAHDSRRTRAFMLRRAAPRRGCGHKEARQASQHSPSLDFEKWGNVTFNVDPSFSAQEILLPFKALNNSLNPPNNHLPNIVWSSIAFRRRRAKPSSEPTLLLISTASSPSSPSHLATFNLSTFHRDLDQDRNCLHPSTQSP